MHWYDWYTVTERLQGRTYALTRGQPYKVILDPNTPTGCCNFTDKRILINPNLFSDVFRRHGLSDNSLDKANFLVSRAVTGHEALHVLYSNPEVVLQAATESPMLKMVLNLLEDARIERIGSQTSRVSKTLFRFVNGIAADELPEFIDVGLTRRHSCLSLLLRWRLGAPIPRLQPDAQKLWEQVLALANKALYAPTCREVLDLARQIVTLLGLDQETQDSDLPDEEKAVAKRVQSDMAGQRSSDPLPNPTTPEEQADDAGPSEDSPEADAGAEQSDQTSADNQQLGGADSKDEDESSDALTGDQEADSADGNADEETEEDSEADPSELPDSGDTTDNPDAPCSEPTRSPDQNKEDLERLVEETAAQVSEDLDSLVPQQDDNSSLVAKATPFRGRIYSDVVASPYAHLLPFAALIAAELVRELRAEGPRAVNGPSENAGRFKTRYYVRDSGKPFTAQRFQGLTIPKMALSLVIDRSGSMEHILHELQTMSMAVTMTCENLQIPLSVWALEGQVHIKHFDEHGPQVLAKIAGIQADTLTRVMPTLTDAVAELKSRPEELKQIVLIHDGMPSDRQDFIDWRSELRGIGIFCLFIMREEDYHNYQQNPQQVREHMDDLVGPRNYAIAPVTGIAKHWCSFIRNTRNHYTTPVR